MRKAARELLTDALGLQMSGYPAAKYLDLLGKEVDIAQCKWQPHDQA